MKMQIKKYLRSGQYRQVCLKCYPQLYNMKTSIHPFTVPASSRGRGHRGLLEPIPAVSRAVGQILGQSRLHVLGNQFSFIFYAFKQGIPVHRHMA